MQVATDSEREGKNIRSYWKPNSEQGTRNKPRSYTVQKTGEKYELEFE